MAMLLGCTGEMPPLYSALCFCFYFAYRYARLLDCRIGSMGSSHESRISRGQKRLRLLTGNCREYLLNLHGTVRWRIGWKPSLGSGSEVQMILLESAFTLPPA